MSVSDDMIARLHPIAHVRDGRTLDLFGQELQDNPSRALYQPCASRCTCPCCLALTCGLSFGSACDSLALLTPSARGLGKMGKMIFYVRALHAVHDIAQFRPSLSLGVFDAINFACD